VSVQVLPVDWDKALAIATRMRERDWIEMAALRFAPSREAFAGDAVEAAKRGPAAVIALDGAPVVIGGISIAHPGLGVFWMWATDEFRRVVKTAARIGRIFKASVHKAGVHRIQAISRADYHDAHQWIRFFGLREEARLRAYGADGADYIVFAEVCNVHEQRHSG